MAFSIMYWMNFVSGTKKLHQKSEVAVKSEHVLKFVYDYESQHLQGRVQASMRDRSYHVNITLGDNHTIADSTCDCVNGKDKCHHKASLLLYGYSTRMSSKLMLGHHGYSIQKSVPPKKTQTMEELFPAPLKLANYRAISRPVEMDDVKFLCDKLKDLGQFSGYRARTQKTAECTQNKLQLTAVYDEAMHWIVSEEPPAPKLDVPCLEDLLLTSEYISAVDKAGWLKIKLAISQEQIEQVAKVTVGQRNNHLWSLVRKYRLTASNFGLVLAAIRRNRFPPSLFKQILSSYNLSSKDAILWGINNESVAKAKYCSYGDAVIEETGIWLNESGILGASPDGIIRRSATYNYNHQVPELSEVLESMGVKAEVIEVKCPFSARNMTIPEAISSVKGFCLDFQIHKGKPVYRLKEDHTYYDQVQGQLHILKKSTCDFVVWTTKDIAIVRVLQDAQWTQNMEKLLDFYFTRIIPIVQT